MEKDLIPVKYSKLLRSIGEFINDPFRVGLKVFPVVKLLMAELLQKAYSPASRENTLKGV